MNKNNRAAKPTRLCHLRLAGAVIAAPLIALMSGTASAFEFDTGYPDMSVRWDNTVKYSTAWRLKDRSPTLTNNPPATINLDDGDRNFGKGLISNRLDLLTELDVTYKGWGGRVSGAGWFDDVYNRGNDNDSPSTANSASVAHNEFTGATRKLHGRKLELLDAFLFGKADLGSTKLTFRAGRHTLLWGESLFFGNNGIANGQAPIDVIKALSVPNTQFKELLRPTSQLSGQLQLNSEVAVGAFYQFRWEKTRVPAAGSYFSSADIYDAGAERLLAGAPLMPGGRPAAFFRGADQEAKNSGQGGTQLRFRNAGVDYGLYAIRYHDKVPQLYLKPSIAVTPFGPAILDPANFDPVAGKIGQFYWVFPESIKAYGASASTTVGDVNIAAEVSVRHNTPLVSDAQLVLPGISADNDNPLYAVGRSAHAQISWIVSMGPSFIAREASLLGEIAWNRRTSITKNAMALDPNTTRDAWGVRMLYEPTYRQVWPGVDLTGLLGGSYFPRGRSSVVSQFGPDRGGDVSIGVSGSYLDSWRFSINYTHYYGPEAPFLDANNHFNMKQSLADRDFIAVSVRRTF